MLGFIGFSLVILGYVAPIRDTLKGQTKPHIYTWLVWAIATAIVAFLQISANAGFGVLVTIAATGMCFTMFILGLRNGTKNITTTDTFFFIMAIAALILWLVAKQPELSTTMVTLMDLFAFVPTIRKSWDEPWSETLSFYWLTTLRYSFGIAALASFSFVTATYPIAMVVSCACIGIYLMLRRQVIPKPTTS